MGTSCCVSAPNQLIGSHLLWVIHSQEDTDGCLAEQLEFTDFNVNIFCHCSWPRFAPTDDLLHLWLDWLATAEVNHWWCVPCYVIRWVGVVKLPLEAAGICETDLQAICSQKWCSSCTYDKIIMLCFIVGSWLCSISGWTGLLLLLSYADGVPCALVRWVSLVMTWDYISMPLMFVSMGWERFVLNGFLMSMLMLQDVRHISSSQKNPTIVEENEVCN